jgi:tetratricopeptide (TPR) repeat protein
VRVFAPYQSLFHLSAFIFISPLSGMNASLYLQNPGAQTQAPAPSRPTQHDSVEVTARISPEEAEEGKLNDLYQPVYALQRGGRCTADIIRRYQVEVIQPAEKSAFNVPKSKFLFLANRDIGDCYLEFQKFPEAEASFQRALQFVSVWPGTDDSDYPILFRQIATAELGQQRLMEAEQSLLKSVALFEPQIAAGEKVDAKLKAHLTRNYRGSQSLSYALLAVVYFREGRTQESLATMDKAFDEVTKYELDASYYNQVLELGKRIADASGDDSARQTWSQRKPK